MTFSKENLAKAAETGSREVSHAFSKLSNEEVSVEASAVEVVSYDKIAEALKPSEDYSIVTYAQIIEGVAGAAILAIRREETLILIDLLNKQEVGSTGIIMDIDRSAVKETLNILSNTYLNALSKITGEKLIIGAPYLMTAAHVGQIIEKLYKEKTAVDSQVIVFKTVLEIVKHKIMAELFIVFDESLANLIKSK